MSAEEETAAAAEFVAAQEASDSDSDSAEESEQKQTRTQLSETM